MSKDYLKVIFSFAQSLLDHISEHVMKFLFSIRVGTPLLKAGPLRISVFSLRSNDFDFEDFFLLVLSFGSFFVGENNFCLRIIISVFLSPRHQVKRLPEGKRRFFPNLFFHWEHVGEQSCLFSYNFPSSLLKIKCAQAFPVLEYNAEH